MQILSSKLVKRNNGGITSHGDIYSQHVEILTKFTSYENANSLLNYWHFYMIGAGWKTYWKIYVAELRVR